MISTTEESRGEKEMYSGKQFENENVHSHSNGKKVEQTRVN